MHSLINTQHLRRCCTRQVHTSPETRTRASTKARLCCHLPPPSPSLPPSHPQHAQEMYRHIFSRNPHHSYNDDSTPPSGILRRTTTSAPSSRRVSFADDALPSRPSHEATSFRQWDDRQPADIRAARHARKTERRLHREAREKKARREEKRRAKAESEKEAKKERRKRRHATAPASSTHRPHSNH